MIENPETGKKEEQEISCDDLEKYSASSVIREKDDLKCFIRKVDAKTGEFEETETSCEDSIK